MTRWGKSWGGLGPRFISKRPSTGRNPGTSWDRVTPYELGREFIRFASKKSPFPISWWSGNTQSLLDLAGSEFVAFELKQFPFSMS